MGHAGPRLLGGYAAERAGDRLQDWQLTIALVSTSMAKTCCVISLRDREDARLMPC